MSQMKGPALSGPLVFASCLESEGAAVTARICATCENAFFSIDHDRPGVAHRLIPVSTHVNVVAARSQTGDARLSDASFHVYASGLLGCVFAPAPAWRFDRGLRIHMVESLSLIHI